MNILEYLIENVRTCPDKTAFSDTQMSCTYKELLDQCCRVSAFLQNHLTDVKKETPVPIGVFADHDVLSLIAFAGIACSGNFYIPIDPRQPETKIEKILLDSGAPAVIGRSGQDTLLPASYTGQFFEIAGCLEEAAAAPDQAIVFPADDKSHHPLYMVYTSGSTGNPKGVLKSHEAVCDFIEAYTDTFDFQHEEVIGNQTPFFFDASAKDIYLTLKMGATMEIIPEEKFLLPPALIRYLNEKKITFISWVPSALALITQYNTFTELVPETLKKVFFVGEAFPVKHFRKWQEALPDIEYVNLYGASELAGICCYYRVPPGFDGDSLPIGKPLKNCKVYLADNEVKDSVKVITEPKKTGEIYLVSNALAMQYYNDPDKTAASFITVDGERTFKTGDLAWYDEDMDLHFAARNDSQIKHMGQRIELGEIESICQTLPVIDKACCLYNSEKKRIYLFCQLSPGAQEDMKSILIKLKNILVTYMMPQRVVIKDRLPVNANGKIDRQALKNEM